MAFLRLGTAILVSLNVLGGTQQSESLSEDSSVREAMVRLIEEYSNPPIHEQAPSGPSRFDRNEILSLAQSFDVRLLGRESEPLLETPDGKVLVKSHWYLVTPPLPFDRSDAIVSATVVDSQAFFTESQTALFSVYQARVETVYTSLRDLKPGATVLITREGGSLRTRSGKVVEFRVDRQGFPRRGDEYLLFLGEIDGISSYRILDGYCTNGNWAIPFDDRPNHDFAGMPTEQLLEIVRKGVNSEFGKPRSSKTVPDSLRQPSSIRQP